MSGILFLAPAPRTHHYTREMDTNSQLQLFRKSLHLRVRIREIAQLLGSAENKVCLDAGFENGLVSRALRRHGGTWHTLVMKEEQRGPVAEALESEVRVLDGARMPFDDKTFDVVILSDLLERVSDDKGIISECHRVLKATGIIIIDVRHAKSWSVLGPVETMLGIDPMSAGYARPGYSEWEVFDLLKGGFDVHTVRSYCGFFSQLVDVIVRHMIRKLPPHERDSQTVPIYSKAYPFYWIAYQFLDLLAFMFKGYRLTAFGKRHAWHSREPPVLNDGRTLREVVLSRISD